MKNVIFLISLMLIITISVLANDNVVAFEYDKYIVQNVGSGKYWGAGNDWGVRASLIDNPEFLIWVPLEDGTYNLESQVCNGGDAYYFNGEYMDNSSPIALSITKLANGNFTIARTDNGTFYGYDGTSTVLGKGLTNADDPNAQWTIVTLDDAKAALADATEEAPMNANVLFDDLNFGRNNRYSNKWTTEGGPNLSGGNNTNNNAESYMKAFEVSQEVDAPNGVYAVTAQAAVTYHDNRAVKEFDGVDPVQIYANEETADFFIMETADQMSSQSRMSERFTAGKYTIEPIYVEVTNGKLKIGAKSVRSDIWAVWDNYQITYYGGSGNITFTDENIKKLCIAKWDKNGDGELDTKEAAIVTDIGDVFKGNKNITSFSELLFFTGITLIEDEAFAGCTNLTNIGIPRNVQRIGNEIFSGCSSLNKIFVSQLNKYYKDDNSNSIIEIATNKLIIGCKSSKISTNITSIGHSAFKGCKGLTSIMIPRSVTSIESSAFQGCVELSKVESRSQVPYSFGENAFSSISSDCILIIPKGTKDKYLAAGWTEDLFKGGIVEDETIISFADTSVETICLLWDTDDDGQISYKEAACVTDFAGVFTSNSQITSFDELQYFTGLVSISDNTFSSCSGLTSVSIPSSVTSIGNSAFMYCTALTSISIPSSVTSIGNSAFQGCTRLISTYIPNNVTIIGDRAFQNCTSLMTVNIPNNVIAIGDYTFSGCSGLISISIPNSVTSIGRFSFEGCNGITSLTIPYSVTSIQSGAFYGCNNVKSLVISDGDNAIRASFNGFPLEKLYLGRPVTGGGFTRNCTTLKDVTLGKKYPSIPDYAFEGCINLVKVQGGNGVNSIGTHAFRGCERLESFFIPDGVDKIEDGTFYDCKQLENIHIGTGVNSIGVNAFRGCEKLKSCSIPDGVNKINDGTFYGCKRLSEIRIGSGVEEIGDSVFYNCPLTRIYNYADCPQNCGKGVFSIVKYNCKLYVEEDYQDLFRVHQDWYAFNIQPMDAEALPVHNLKIDNKLLQSYDLSGRKQSQKTNGLNIIRKLDGTTKKVIMK